MSLHVSAYRSLPSRHSSRASGKTENTGNGRRRDWKSDATCAARCISPESPQSSGSEREECTRRTGEPHQLHSLLLTSHSSRSLPAFRSASSTPVPIPNTPKTAKMSTNRRQSRRRRCAAASDSGAATRHSQTLASIAARNESDGKRCNGKPSAAGASMF